MQLAKAQQWPWDLAWNCFFLITCFWLAIKHAERWSVVFKSSQRMSEREINEVTQQPKTNVTEYIVSFFNTNTIQQTVLEETCVNSLGPGLWGLVAGDRTRRWSWLTKTEPWEHSWNNFDRMAERLLQTHSCTQAYTCISKHESACGHIVQDKNTRPIHTHTGMKLYPFSKAELWANSTAGHTLELILLVHNRALGGWQWSPWEQ